MAKQTFTTGQVLTAAQMTSLQQTAMLGGSASAKTASYTLVAADAGTAISMSNASATTITVNTALFAAGDTVQITNLGVGVCTITAGTATVNTASSLALAQYESGTLDFTSTSAAIFIKGAGAAASSGGMTLINTGGTTLTGASVSITSIPTDYVNLFVIVRSFKPASDGQELNMQFNTDTGSNYSSVATNGQNLTVNTIWMRITDTADDTVANGSAATTIYDYANTSTVRIANGLYWGNSDGVTTTFHYRQYGGIYKSTGTAITSIQFKSSSGNLTSGTVFVYGVK